MRLVFFGNPDFCKHPLLSIYKSDHELLSVVTNIDRQSGRGLNISSTYVKQKALELNVPVIETEDVNSESLYQTLTELNPDIFVVVAFSILPDRILNIPKKCSINIHPSMLPKYRGSSPIQYALLNGDKKTGVTIIDMNENVDSGNILGQKEMDIPNDANFGYLYEKLGILGSKLLLEVIDNISNDRLNVKKQDHDKKTFAPKIKKSQYKINFDQNGLNIYNQIRAFDPYPGAYGILNDKRIKLFGVKIFSEKVYHEYKVGQLIIDGKLLLIYVGKITLSISKIQVEGKKRVEASDYIKGLNHKETLIVK
tara:strand:+ start:1657 stop:2586 length:930 start_codon:yes stop_codon:yes gene_type:complete